AAHCTTRKSTRSSRAIRAALAGVTAALLFVCGIFGGLSWLPLVGGMLEPMTVYAADVRVIIGPDPQNSSGFYGVSVSANGQHVSTHSIVKDQELNLSDFLSMAAPQPHGEPWNVTLELQTDVEIGELSYNQGDLRIIGTGKKLTCNGNDCGIYIIDGNLILDGVTVIANAGTGEGVLVQGSSGTGGELGIGNGGSLTASGNDAGVAANKMKIDSFSEVKAVSGNGAGIRVNESLTIWSCATVEASGETYGIEVTGGNLTVEGGANVKAEGKSGAFNAPSGSITATGYTSGATSYTSGKFAPPAITPTPAPTSAPASSCATGHASYTWQTVTSADEHNDGEMVFACAGCGHVLYRVPLSASVPFQKVTAEKIQNAAQGATVEITTSRWYSFHRSVMEALAARPDVTRVVSFLREGYKGDRLVFTIPAGTDTIALLNEEGYAGFFYISGMLGTLRPAN
ncbi:MAG: hypothetical protein IJQ26_05550, partial [Lachnospiraceae bacterium]|nr:hypothetical protein [Lachnospiraceae bacterium]